MLADAHLAVYSRSIEILVESERATQAVKKAIRKGTKKPKITKDSKGKRVPL